MSQATLDHLILFLPPSPTTNKNTPFIPPFFTKNFTITPGGTHADNLTANELIILADGCYIELICFLPSPNTASTTAADAQATAIQNHWWGPSPHRKGWTDWCLTTPSPTSPSTHPSTHAPPIAGARKRPDGVQVKWTVTFPYGEKGGQRSRGKVPFYCHDVTPRAYRVPITDTSTRHACGAVGVRQLSVIVDGRDALEEMRGVYAMLFGREGVVGEDGDEVRFEVGRVQGVEGVGGGARVLLRLARDEGERERVGERGFWFGDVVLAAKAGEGREVGTRERIDGEEDVGGLWVEYV